MSGFTADTFASIHSLMGMDDTKHAEHKFITELMHNITKTVIHAEKIVIDYAEHIIAVATASSFSQGFISNIKKIFN